MVRCAERGAWAEIGVSAGRCVLLELVGLRHAFEARDMKSLVNRFDPSPVCAPFYRTYSTPMDLLTQHHISSTFIPA